MKVEFGFNLDWKKAVVVFVVVLFAFGAGFFSGQSMETESEETCCLGSPSVPLCLTTADLNRSDIGASIVLSRFCEGMGLQSSVLWQQDSQGNTYGLPICMKTNNG